MAVNSEQLTFISHNRIAKLDDAEQDSVSRHRPNYRVSLMNVIVKLRR